MARPRKQYAIGDRFEAGTIIGLANPDATGATCVTFSCAHCPTGVAVARLSQLETGKGKSCRCKMVKAFNEFHGGRVKQMPYQKQREILERVENDQNSSVTARQWECHATWSTSPGVHGSGLGWQPSALAKSMQS